MGKAVEKLKTQQDLANAVGRSIGTINNWVHRADWPFGPPPWPRAKAPDILRWAAETLANTGSGRGGDDETQELRKEKLKEEVRKLRGQADTVEVELGTMRGKLLDREEVNRGRVARVHALRSRMAELPMRSAQLVGCDEATIERTMLGWMQEICEHFAGDKKLVDA